MQVKEMTRRYNGQILACGYGHQWPLNLYTNGFVRITIETTAKGKIKLSHTWAETKDKLAA